MSDTQATHLIGRFVVLLLLKPVGDVVFPACLKARLHIMCFEVPAFQWVVSRLCPAARRDPIPSKTTTY